MDTHTERVPHSTKMAIYKPGKEAWNRSFPDSRQKEPALPKLPPQTSRLQNSETKNICCLNQPFYELCGGSPRTLTQPVGSSAQPRNSPTNTVPHLQPLQFQPFNLWSRNETSDFVLFMFVSSSCCSWHLIQCLAHRNSN